MSFFGFGQTADISIELTPRQPSANNKQVDLKNDDGTPQKKQNLYYDGESVSGVVNINLRTPGKKLEHQGIKIEFIGQIELFYDRGNHHEFTSLVKELVKPGEMISNGTFKFDFLNVEKSYESYTGTNVRLRYFLKVTISRRLADIVKEEDIAVHTLSSYPEMNNSIKMEVNERFAYCHFRMGNFAQKDHKQKVLLVHKLPRMSHLATVLVCMCARKVI